MSQENHHLELEWNHQKHKNSRFINKINTYKTHKVFLFCFVTVVIVSLTGFLFYATKKCERPLIETVPDYPIGAKNYPIPADFMTLFWQPTIQQNAQLSDKAIIIGKIYTTAGLNEPSNDIVQFQKEYYKEKYNISKFEKELPFCIVVASYNNIRLDRYKFNLNSIFRQDYKNFKVVYIDDASPDKTGQAVKSYVREKGFASDRFIPVINEQNHGPMYNHRMAGKKYCNPTDIMLIIDGDDAFAGKFVLKMLNANFQSQEAWYIYTNNILVKKGEIGVSRRIPPEVVKSNSYRQHINKQFITGHMRAFYNQLFLQVPDQYMQIPSTKQYFPASGDRSMMVAMNELAQENFIYVPEMTYVYNSETELSEWVIRRDDEVAADKIIARMKPLQKLKCLFYDKEGACIPTKDLINRMNDVVLNKYSWEV